MKKWQDKEKRDAKDFGARIMPRSGGLWFAKGDSKNDTFLIENKSTKNKSFSITTKLWEKLEREALVNQRLPLLSVELEHGKKEVVILSKDDFLSLMGGE